MGTSLLWQTDTQLHDAVQRQLDWDPEINARDIAEATCTRGRKNKKPSARLGRPPESSTSRIISS